MINKNNLYKYANSIDNNKTKKMDNVGKSNKSKKMDKKTDSKAEIEKSAEFRLSQNAIKALNAFNALKRKLNPGISDKVVQYYYNKAAPKMENKINPTMKTEKSAAIVLKNLARNSIVPYAKSVKSVRISPEMKNKIKYIAGKSAIPAASALGGMVVGGGLKELQNASEKSNPTISDISERIYNLLRNYIGKLFS